MKVNHKKILSAALGGPGIGPVVGHEDGKWLLIDIFGDEQQRVILHHPDFDKFCWLVAEWHEKGTKRLLDAIKGNGGEFN